MKLRFLGLALRLEKTTKGYARMCCLTVGQTYTTAKNKVPTVATQQTASFKGQKYQVSVLVQTTKSQSREVKKYRGVAYTV